MELNEMNVYKVHYKFGLSVFFALLISSFLLMSIMTLLILFWKLDFSSSFFILLPIIFMICFIILRGNHIKLENGNVSVVKLYFAKKTIRVQDINNIEIKLVDSQKRSMYYGLHIMSRKDNIILNYVTYNKKLLAAVLKLMIEEAHCSIDNSISNFTKNYLR